MILADTGPLVALFDPRDPSHERCVDALRKVRGLLVTTTAVLTECFHMLTPASHGARGLREFIAAGGLTVWYLDEARLTRAFELMEDYSDHPMDFADASLVVAAERLGTRHVLTLDRKDFDSYRVRRGHRHLPLQVIHC